MAFNNSVMPKIKLIHGVQKQVIDPVTVIGNGNRETRRKQNRYSRYAWKFPSRSVLTETKQELYDFFRTVNMSLDSFLFQDPDRPTFAGEQLVNKTGNIWYLEVDGHPIFNPGMSGLTFKVGGVAKSATFAIDTSGRPTVTVTDSLEGSVVTVEGPLYLAVRLNAPISWAISAMERGDNCTPTPLIVDMSDIDLIEVFEHA